MKQLTMNLSKATASDILDVSQGMANGRNKVDLIKRKVGTSKKRHGSVSYESAFVVAGQLTEVLCYEKRKGVWRIPTQQSVYSVIRNMALAKKISSARSDDHKTIDGNNTLLVSYNEVRRHLLSNPKYDLQANRDDHGGIVEKVKRGKNKPVPARPSFWVRVIRWLMMFNKEVV